MNNLRVILITTWSFDHYCVSFCPQAFINRGGLGLSSIGPDYIFFRYKIVPPLPLCLFSSSPATSCFHSGRHHHQDLLPIARPPAIMCFCLCRSKSIAHAVCHNMYVPMCVFAHVCVRALMYVLICARVCVCVCIDTVCSSCVSRVSVSVCICMCVLVRVRVRTWVCFCGLGSSFVYEPACVCVCTHVYVRVCT
jgi:hypothetical protein